MADEYIRKADAVSIAESYEVKRDGFYLNDYEYGRNQVADSIASDLEDMPPADVAPVVHAYWYIMECEYLICSECEGQYHTGCETTLEAEKMLEEGLCPSYCPHCGAKMDGEE